MMMTATWCEPHPEDLRPTPRDGRRWCGPLEPVLRRLWSPEDGPPGSGLVAAVDDLAALEYGPAVRLAAGLAMVWIGGGGIGYVVKDPDGVTGRSLSFTRAAADPQAPSAARTLAAHALCDLDGLAGTLEWRALARRCLPLFRERPAPGPRDWWAESFALGTPERIGVHLGGDLAMAGTVAAYHQRIVASYPGPPYLP
ncbi:hypothetical protein [Nonomuraea typhae]|uniref:hypothetical protein n=1 Tax=Nonomuraea typhae TaxID=2603600 RepID=UPI0012FA9CF0|nr:hypothetical protein [Nonomuraea typhae]